MRWFHEHPHDPCIRNGVLTQGIETPIQGKILLDWFPSQFTSMSCSGPYCQTGKKKIGSHWTRNRLGANHIWRIKAAENFIGATWSLARRGPVAVAFVEVNRFPQVHHAHGFAQRSFGAALQHAVIGSQQFESLFLC